MQTWYERGGPEGGLPRGGVEEYRHRMMETGHGLMLGVQGYDPHTSGQ